MKSYSITAAFCLVLSLSVSAQMRLSTDQRKDGIWDNESEEWVIVSTDDEELTFFEFNEALTMFKHTTASITSAYIIKSSTHDEENNRYEFEVVSDVGNKYLMILDVENSNIRFIHEKDGVMLLVWHRIKSAWVEED